MTARRHEVHGDQRLRVESSQSRHSHRAKTGIVEARAIFGLDTTTLLLIVLAIVVAIWTARLAYARGKNPWVWSGVALILGIPWPSIGLPILGIVPVLFLMFFVRPVSQGGWSRPNTCSRCASSHSPGQNFCTKCGWDLSREYTPEGSDTVLASEMRQSQGSSAATMERPVDTTATEESTSAASPAAPTPEAVIPDNSVAESAEAHPETASESGASGETPEPEAEPEPDARPWGIPQPGPAPTAAVMTARGEALLNEGKLQEAIDQFTKAIALNPRHREAFERRAEAYTKQGRDERAEEDYRQVQALNTGA